MLSSPFRTRALGLCAAIAVLLLDQWSKHVMLSAVTPREICPFFNLVLVHNRGISFGLFSQMQNWMPLLLTVTTSIVALMLMVWLWRVNEGILAFALGMVIGGALGNIIDRMRLSAVTDFLDFHWRAYHWPAFNIADSAIFIGVVILVLISIVHPQKKEAV